MPEGPEIFKTSAFINVVCRGRIFGGKVIKSAVNWKNPEVTLPFQEYTIESDSKGKELMLHLLPVKSANRKDTTDACSVNVLFHFGMSGKFTFCQECDVEKHAHLMFRTQEENERMVLSFVDTRRFGRWQLSDAWSSDRGPDPIKEYKLFRRHILGSLDEKAFSKPLCELMLNQKYFNGIGNYLRAEILFRASLPPFVCARTVLEELPLKNEDASPPDILDLCHSIPTEVTLLRETCDDDESQVEAVTYGTGGAFLSWLRCYAKPEMSNMVDHDGRTIWYKGSAGPMAPCGRKSRNGKKKRTSNRKESSTIKEDPVDASQEVETKPKLPPPSKMRKIAGQAIVKEEKKMDGNPQVQMDTQASCRGVVVTRSKAKRL